MNFLIDLADIYFKRRCDLVFDKDGEVKENINNNEHEFILTGDKGKTERFCTGFSCRRS